MKQLLLTTLLLLSFLLTLPASAEEPVTLRIDAVDGMGYPLIITVVTVRDEFGVPIPELGLDNFSVREDLSPPRTITAVEPVVNPEVQLSVLLAVDVSGSMQGGKLDDAQLAARRFLAGLTEEDDAALIAFAGSIDLDDVDTDREYEFGGDKEALVGIINGLTANGATPLYDAAYKAVQWAADQPPGNRAVVLFTDGKEEKSEDGGGSQIANEDSPIFAANQNGIPIFTIGLGDDTDEMYLRRLALQTGGIYQHADQSDELAQLFVNVSDLLKQQYHIQYESGLPGDGKTHSLRVDVKKDNHKAYDDAEFAIPFVPTPTPEGVTPEPTDTPTPTHTPVSPTDTPVPPTDTPTPVPLPTPTVTPDPPDSNTFLGLTLPQWAGILGGLLLLLLIAAFIISRRKKPGPTTTHYCAKCGHEVPAPF